MVRKSKNCNFNCLTPKPVSLTTVLSYFPSHRTLESLGGRGPQVSLQLELRPYSRPDSILAFKLSKETLNPRVEAKY